MQPSWAYRHSTHGEYFYLCFVKSQDVGRTDACLFTVHMNAVCVLLATGQSPEQSLTTTQNSYRPHHLQLWARIRETISWTLLSLI